VSAVINVLKEDFGKCFTEICKSISVFGENEAKRRFEVHEARQSLKDSNGREEYVEWWEASHLQLYIREVKRRVNENFMFECLSAEPANIKKDLDISRLTSEPRKDTKKHQAIFKALGKAQENISTEECFYDFLKFCSKNRLRLDFFGDSHTELKKTIVSFFPYIDYLKNTKSDNVVIEHEALNGLSIQWKQPNNEHEMPVCKLEPCYGQKHLVIPNTYDNIDLEQPSTVLGWSSNLTRFVGRQEELEQLTLWLESGAEKSIQVITGDGGTGKTRLAFHFAEEIALDKGWEAGQAGSDLAGRWFFGEEGILLIIDYPEERKTTVKQFLKSVYEADLSQTKKRLRVLLLSRDVDFPDFVEEEAPRLSNKSIHLHGLGADVLQWELAIAAWQGLLYQQKSAATPIKPDLQQEAIAISEEAFRQWQNKAEIHKTPLMTISLVFYAFVEPEILEKGILELTAHNIIRYMTKREIRYIRKEVTEYFGLKKLSNTCSVEGIFLLKAVSAIAGGVRRAINNLRNGGCWKERGCRPYT
jgi:hypothetical protein